MNVSLYGRTRRWAMTERGPGSLQRDAQHLAIGPSSLRWHDGVLDIEIRERCCPLPRGVRGRVRIRPQALTGQRIPLDAAGLHRWSPMAPRATVEVALDQPELRWTGDGYLDSNDGDGPLEASFRRWDWCRAPLSQDRTAILYDVTDRRGDAREVALQVDRAGRTTALEAAAKVRLPRTRWRLPRHTRADATGAHVVRTLQDSPFYARSVLHTNLLGEPAEAMHESLDLDRFAAPLTQAMLPFRIPRALS
ncbi:carotenoid 1,2-hydratase [Lichenicoccus roseus]|uniref:carotenoid 1,2-hydratase n=1 Tax=Lichenicoccus roseus TaxID=2683649 RepID=UPI001F10094B|nr:carotenoid 1,2-hydratase [Lichenicoccus roseus]